MLKGEKILLIELKIEYLDELYKLICNPDVLLPNPGFPYPCSKEEFKDKIQEFEKQTELGKGLGFCIYEFSLERLIGCISMQEIDSKNRNAEIGYWIGKEYWRKGYATESIKLILEKGFHQLNLEKIYARVLSNNFASRKLIEKLGFQNEGELRKQVFRNNEFQNIVLYGLLRKEYLSNGGFAIQNYDFLINLQCPILHHNNIFK